MGSIGGQQGAAVATPTHPFITQGLFPWRTLNCTYAEMGSSRLGGQASWVHMATQENQMKLTTSERLLPPFKRDPWASEGSPELKNSLISPS